METTSVVMFVFVFFAALFASVDGNGRLDLWNLNNDTEVATASVYVGASQPGEVPSSNGAALNRVSW